MKRVTVTVDGQNETVWADRIDGELWVHWQGRTLVIPDADSDGRKTRSAGPASATHGGQIKAPMPGKVTQVKVNVGADVKAGETMIVMEAMKMEYTLVADQAGKVVSIQCKAGDPVKLGQVLVQIEGEK